MRPHLIRLGPLVLFVVILTVQHYNTGGADDAKPIKPTGQQLSLKTILAASDTLDQLVAEHRKQQQIATPAALDESLFLRRLSIDLLGRVPTLEEYRAYHANTDRYKKATTVFAMLNSPGFQHRMVTFWGEQLRLRDQLRNNVTGIPYRKWLTNQIASNQPYDEMVQSLLVANGSYWDDNNGSVGFWLRDAGMIEDHLANTVQVFLGTQMQCAQCHDHPFDSWTRRDFMELSAFTFDTKTRFRVQDLGQKGKDLAREARKADITPQQRQLFRRVGQQLTLGVRDNGSGTRKLPTDYQYEDGKPGERIEAHPLFGEDISLSGAKPGREQLALWLTSPNNERFAPVLVNRLWAMTMGSGFVEPVDDWRDGIEPSAPKILDFLAAEFIAADFDVKTMLAIICTSDAYAAAGLTEEANLGEAWTGGERPLRRLSAEELWNSFCTLVVPNIDQRPGPTLNDPTDRIRGLRELPAAEIIERLTAGSALEIKRREIQQQVRALRDKANEARAKDDRKALRAVQKEQQALRKQVNELRAQLQTMGLEGGRNRAFLNRKDQTGQWKGLEAGLVRAAELPWPAPENHFLRRFGQGDRELIADGSRSPNVTQALALLNEIVDQHIARPDALLMQQIQTGGSREEQVRRAYTAILSRLPSDTELQRGAIHLQTYKQEGMVDLVWALINSREFLFVR